MYLMPQIKQAFSNLFAAKMRSILAILGILIGTASVVAMVSSGEFATRKALAEFKQLGTDLLAMSIFSENPSDRQAMENTFDLNTVLAIKNVSPIIKEVAPYSTLYMTTSFQSEDLQASIIGVTESLRDIIKIQVHAGRFISFLDEYSYFCVIGNKLAQSMRGKGIVNPLGQQIKIGDIYFTVIGIADPWPENAFFNGDINRAILIPVQATKILSKNATISNVVFRLQLKEGETTDSLQEKITRYVDKKQSGLKLFFRSSKELIKSMEKQQQIFTLLLGLIGSISLIVGGIGVMNIMLVSVLERKREIGIRLAVGATQKDIRSLFLIEAVALSVIGGIIGVLLGIIISYLVAQFAEWDFAFLLLPPMVGFFVSVAVGIFFGFYPAYQASQLDPILTLRSD